VVWNCLPLLPSLQEGTLARQLAVVVGSGGLVEVFRCRQPGMSAFDIHPRHTMNIELVPPALPPVTRHRSFLIAKSSPSFSNSDCSLSCIYRYASQRSSRISFRAALGLAMSFQRLTEELVCIPTRHRGHVCWSNMQSGWQQRLEMSLA
jgi:hypothetical protein